MPSVSLKQSRNNRGVALLIAIIVIMIVLIATATLITTTFQSLRTSSNVLGSIRAFYAQETGTECTRYWVLKDSQYLRKDGEGKIRCNNKTYTLDTSTNVFTYLIGYADTNSETEVTVTHDTVSDNLTVQSFGYNAPPSASQRNQWYRETEIAGLCLSEGDYILVIDESQSIDSVELQTMREHINNFSERVQPFETNNEVHVGRVAFAAKRSGVAGVYDSTVEPRKSIDGSKEPLAIVSNVSINRIGGNTNMSHGIASGTQKMVNEGRDITEYPQFMILLTDGEPNVHDGVADSRLSVVEDEANHAKSLGMDVYVFGIKMPENCFDFDSTAPEYDVQNDKDCGEWLNDAIAGASDNTDPKTPAPNYFFGVDTFDELGDAFANIGNCVTPKVDK